ncbi:11399_t:CDS:2, partial [Dentiscutata erythropus]
PQDATPTDSASSKNKSTSKNSASPQDATPTDSASSKNKSTSKNSESPQIPAPTDSQGSIPTNLASSKNKSSKNSTSPQDPAPTGSQDPTSTDSVNSQDQTHTDIADSSPSTPPISTDSSLNSNDHLSSPTDSPPTSIPTDSPSSNADPPMGPTGSIPMDPASPTGGPQINQLGPTGGPQNQPNPTGGPQNQPNPTGGPQNQQSPTGGPQNQPNPTGGPQNQPNPTGGPQNHPNPTGGPQNQPNPTGGPQNQPSPTDKFSNQSPTGQNSNSGPTDKISDSSPTNQASNQGPTNKISNTNPTGYNIVSNPSSTDPPSPTDPSSKSSAAPDKSINDATSTQSSLTDPSSKYNAAPNKESISGATYTASTTIYTYTPFNPTAVIKLPLRTNTRKSNDAMPTNDPSNYPSKIVTPDSAKAAPQDSSKLFLTLSPALSWESVVRDTTIPAAMTVQLTQDIAKALGCSPDDVKILSLERGVDDNCIVNIAIPSKYTGNLQDLVSNKDSSLYQQGSEFAKLVDSVEDNSENPNGTDNGNNAQSQYITSAGGLSSKSALVIVAVFGSAFLYVGATILAVRAYKKRKARSEANTMDV